MAIFLPLLRQVLLQPTFYWAISAQGFIAHSILLSAMAVARSF